MSQDYTRVRMCDGDVLVSQVDAQEPGRRIVIDWIPAPVNRREWSDGAGAGLECLDL